jgi:peroxidase
MATASQIHSPLRARLIAAPHARSAKSAPRLTGLCLGALAATVAAASPPGGLQRSPVPTPDCRSITGWGNNRAQPSWGSAGTDYLREISGAHYADGLSAPAGASRPSPRLISNLISDQGDDETADERGLSTAVYEFGQFLDHDIGLALGGASESFNIPVPTGDLWFDPLSTGIQVIPMARSGFDPRTGTTVPRQQINTVTAFIDASQVYGSDPIRAAWLRSHQSGGLKVDATPQGDMLPFNDGTLANDNPLGLPVTSLRIAGDTRANEQPGLTVLHTVFLREHNWHADRLHAAHPDWNDDRLYQEARRIVAAEMQVIVTREFLPTLLHLTLSPYTGYKPWVNPGLSNAFATAAYRVGHSMVGPDIDLLDENFQPIDVLPLDAVFFNPLAIPAAGGVEPFVRYMITSTQQITDTKVVTPLRNFLFGPPGAGGLDLVSLNIQRGRDHGLADYNTLRADYGLPRVTSFSEITSDPDLAQRLLDLYSNPDNIDPWVGMLAEDHLPGSSMGRTHTIILVDQFTRLRDGDRFWYLSCGFSAADIAVLESTHLSDIFARNTGVTGLQQNVFFAR